MGIYKPKEFSALIGVSVKTLQRWDKEGKLVEKRTPTNRRYYDDVDLNNYLEQNQKINKSTTTLNTLNLLIQLANQKYDGHFTLMKFTGNWRCCFGTITNHARTAIEQMEVGKTMDEAIIKTIVNDTCAYNFIL